MVPLTAIITGVALMGPGFKLDGNYLMPGLDLSPRPGIEISLATLEDAVWAGFVLGGAYDLRSDQFHGAIALEAGFALFGVEVGAAGRQDGEWAPRFRVLGTAGVVSLYVEHLDFDGSPWSGGLLLKVPVDL